MDDELSWLTQENTVGKWQIQENLFRSKHFVPLNWSRTSDFDYSHLPIAACVIRMLSYIVVLKFWSFALLVIQTSIDATISLLAKGLLMPHNTPRHACNKEYIPLSVHGCKQICAWQQYSLISTSCPYNVIHMIFEPGYPHSYTSVCYCWCKPKTKNTMKMG